MVEQNILNLHESSEYAANISENWEHEWDANDAKEKAEDATAHSFGRHVAVTNCRDDWEGEEASLVKVLSFDDWEALIVSMWCLQLINAKAI